MNAKNKRKLKLLKQYTEKLIETLDEGTELFITERPHLQKVLEEQGENFSPPEGDIKSLKQQNRLKIEKILEQAEKNL